MNLSGEYDFEKHPGNTFFNAFYYFYLFKLPGIIRNHMI